jgi:steroid 5-alpha reductase family enzyme
MDSPSSTIINSVHTALVEGDGIRPLAALTAVAIATVVPLTFVRKLWSISVGYGAAIATQSLVLMSAFQVSLIPSSFRDDSSTWSLSQLLVLATLLYGVRLMSYLLMRTFSVKSMEQQGARAEGMSRIKATILGVVVSILYAFMELPVVYALRVGAARGTGRRVLQICGLLTCYLGLIVETVADQQKYNAKRRALVAYGDPKFIGPTGGLYAITRHPNYTGEILFWLGLFVGGAVCFEGNAVAWTFSTLGLWSILSIMLGSTKRLEKKQEDMYGKQEKYEKWRQNVSWPLMPFVERELTIPGAK